MVSAGEHKNEATVDKSLNTYEVISSGLGHGDGHGESDKDGDNGQELHVDGWIIGSLYVGLWEKIS